METDPLTGLGTRSAFLLQGEVRVAEAKAFVLAVANVDHFKQFNMHNGLQAGDEVLRQLAAQLRGVEAFRVAGDSFAMFLADVAQAHDIRRKVAENVNPVQPAHCGDRHCLGVAPPPRLSIGVSPWHAGTFADLLHRVEEALYRAKCNGRNRVELA